SSEYFVDPMNRSARTRFTNSDSDDAIQECVFLCRGFEPRYRSKVVARRIDDLSTAERSDDFRRAMAQPLKRHLNQRVIVGLERDTQVELENAVGAEQQPVTAARQDLAAQSRAFEVAPNNRYDRTNAMRHRSELLRRGCEDFHCHQWLRLHDGVSPFCQWKPVIDAGVMQAPSQRVRRTGNDGRSNYLDHVSAAN